MPWRASAAASLPRRWAAHWRLGVGTCGWLGFESGSYQGSELALSGSFSMSFPGLPEEGGPPRANWRFGEHRFVFVIWMDVGFRGFLSVSCGPVRPYDKLGVGPGRVASSAEGAGIAMPLANTDGQWPPRGMRMRGAGVRWRRARRSGDRDSYWWVNPVSQTGPASGQGPRNGALSP